MTEVATSGPSRGPKPFSSMPQTSTTRSYHGVARVADPHDASEYAALPAYGAPGRVVALGEARFRAENDV